MKLVDDPFYTPISVAKRILASIPTNILAAKGSKRATAEELAIAIATIREVPKTRR